MNSRLKKNKRRKKLRYSLYVLVALIVGISAYIYNVYSDLASAVNNMNNPIGRKVSDKRDDKIQFKRKDPISILLVGVDEREGDNGRTDSMLVMTLNPKQGTSKLVSIPRDTRAELITAKGKTKSYDKMNHAYAFGGIEMTINSIENFLNIPIDYFVEVNMEGFRDIVDAVGGIEVNSPFAFEQDGTYIKEGKQHVNGLDALNYARMRKDDPRGDFGRQERQREVISQLIKQGTSLKTLTNYDKILKALEKNVKTNLTMDDILSIQKLYKDAAKQIDKIEIPGSGGLVNSIWYYIVSDDIRQDLSDQLREHLGLPKTKVKAYTNKATMDNSKNKSKTEEIQQPDEDFVEPIYTLPPTTDDKKKDPKNGDGDGGSGGKNNGTDTGTGDSGTGGNGTDNGNDTGNGNGNGGLIDDLPDNPLGGGSGDPNNGGDGDSGGDQNTDPSDPNTGDQNGNLAPVIPF